MGAGHTHTHTLIKVKPGAPTAARCGHLPG